VLSPQAEANRYWNLLTAVSDRIAARFGEAMREGIIGAPLILPGDCRLSDLELMVLPGLRLFGLDARLTTAADPESLARSGQCHGRPTAFFGLSALPTHPADDEDIQPEPGYPDPLIVKCAVVASEGVRSLRRVHWLVSPGAEPVLSLPEAAAWALVSTRKRRPAGRSFDHTTGVLMRWSAFAAASPERVITGRNTAQLEAMAAFLTQCCGRSRAPWATRLRRAADAFGVGDVGGAMDSVRDAGLMRLGLAAAARNALLSSGPLLGTAKRELIYLVRAGTDELKALAAQRLLADVVSHDIRLTLQQLAHSPNAWLRAIAGMAEA
jgi:hypothetical protein